MAQRTKSILIGCPQHHLLVRGQYDCDESGRYLLAANGAFEMDRVQCGQWGGRCMQTLCALHRYNRRGRGTWLPSQVLAMPDGSDGEPSRRSQRPKAPARQRGMDLLC